MTWTYERWQELLAEFLGPQAEAGPKARKRRRILDAATELFVRHGYRKTSVDEIARKASVSKGSVYSYFDSKSDILVHCAALEKARYASRIQGLFAPELSPHERLRRYLMMVFLLVEDMPLAQRLTQGGEMAHAMEDFSEVLKEKTEAGQREWLSMLLRPFAEKHGWDEAQLTLRGEALIGFVKVAGALMGERDRTRRTREEWAAALTATLMEGLA